MPLSLVLIAVGVIGFFIFSLSVGGLTWWLLSRSHSPPAPGREQGGIPPHPGPLPQGGEGAAIAEPTEWIELFNGIDLEGWDYDPAAWSVRNGVIHGSKRSGAGSALFWRDSDVGDFELRFQFRLIRGNAGVAYRAKRLPNFDVGGYEFEIFTNKTGNLANVGTDRQRYRLHRAADTEEPTDSNWHEAVIIAQGARLIHMLDGKTLCDVEDTNAAALQSGVIAFGTGGGTAVEFKDVRLRRLKSAP